MKADGLDPLPTYTPPIEDPQSRPDLAARFPLQLLSPPRPQFLNSTFASGPNLGPSPATRPSSSPPRTPAPRPGRRRLGPHLQRPRPLPARVWLTGAVRPGTAVATGLFWNKLTPGRSNVNSTTSAALADMGGGATLFDNLVDVRAVS